MDSAQFFDKLKNATEKALSSLSRSDFYYNGKSQMNEFAFKMTVLGAFFALGLDDIAVESEKSVTKNKNHVGYADLVFTVGNEEWIVELKYYSLAFLFYSTFENMKVLGENDFFSHKEVAPRLQKWQKLPENQKLLCCFYQNWVTKEQAQTYTEKGYKILQSKNGTYAPSLQLLNELAKAQVKFYSSGNASRRFTFVGAGDTVFFSEA